MFSCEFCEISKNTFLYRTPPVAASMELRIKELWNSRIVSRDNIGFAIYRKSFKVLETGTIFLAKFLTRYVALNETDF